jgi:hypothetical protein
MNIWLTNVRMMLLSVALILGVYVQQQTGATAHAPREYNTPVFRFLLHNELCEIRLDTKTIGPLDNPNKGTPSSPPHVQPVVDLTDSQVQTHTRELGDTTPSVPTRTSARTKASPVPTPQSAPKELTTAHDFKDLVESVASTIQFRFDNKIDTRMKAYFMPHLLKLSKTAEASSKKLKDLEKELEALRKVRVYGNTTSPSNNGKFPAELSRNWCRAVYCLQLVAPLDLTTCGNAHLRSCHLTT